MFKSNLYKETIMASFQELNDAIQSDLPVNEILFKVKQRIDSNKIELQLDSELPASLLCSAAVANRPEIAKFLLDLKLSSNIVNSKKDGFTALHFACGNASKEVVDILLTAGADTLALDKKGRTASQLAQENLYRTYNQLSNAMHLNQPIGDIMYELKKFKSLPLNIIKEDRHTKEWQDKLLIIAAQNNYPEIIKDLLEMGANKNAQNKDGATALHFAVSNRIESIVILLVESGADSEIKDNKGNTAKNIVQKALLCEYNKLSNAMHLDQPISDIMHNIGFLSLVSMKENKEVEELKNKLLLEAAKNNYPMVVENLIEMGADKNAQNKDGATALHFAVSNGHSSVVAILMHNQVDSTIRDNKGHTAVNIAIERDKNIKNKVILEDNKRNSRRSPDSVAKSWSR